MTGHLPTRHQASSASVKLCTFPSNTFTLPSSSDDSGGAACTVAVPAMPAAPAAVDAGGPTTTAGLTTTTGPFTSVASGTASLEPASRLASVSGTVGVTSAGALGRWGPVLSWSWGAQNPGMPGKIAATATCFDNL